MSTILAYSPGSVAPTNTKIKKQRRAVNPTAASCRTRRSTLPVKGFSLSLSFESHWLRSRLDSCAKPDNEINGKKRSFAVDEEKSLPGLVSLIMSREMTLWFFIFSDLKQEVGLGRSQRRQRACAGTGIDGRCD
jgi:hypothetical protein